jgi:hypothetical protein
MNAEVSAIVEKVLTGDGKTVNYVQEFTSGEIRSGWARRHPTAPDAVLWCVNAVKRGVALEPRKLATIRILGPIAAMIFATILHIFVDGLDGVVDGVIGRVVA